MDMIEKELDAVKNRLREDFEECLPNDSLMHFIFTGSKFIRSALAILYLKSQKLEINEEIFKILSAGELIHNASLLHDDVLDDADIRRGETTIAKKYSPKLSILSGDYLLAYAIEILLELKKNEVLNVFQICTKNMAKAEIEQCLLRGKFPTEQEYLEICKGKTATLFSAILESSAIISGMDLARAKSFGEYYGLCFQIKNDLDFESAQIDENNGIITAESVLGIEKTLNLLDNYKEEMRKLIKDFPENIYKERLEDLINSL